MDMNQGGSIIHAHKLAFEVAGGCQRWVLSWAR